MAKVKKGARGQNEGTIRERFRTTKEGKKVSKGWEARYTSSCDADGKQIQKSIYGMSRKEVMEKLTKTLNDMNSGNYQAPTKIKVSAWLDTWFEIYKKPTVKPKTLECYESIIRLHIKPSIGKIILRELKPEQIQKMYNKIGDELSPRMVELTHVTLHAALEQAMKNDLIFKNISEATTRPKKVKTEPRVLTVDEQQKFVRAIKGERTEAAFLLDLFSGLRLGEIVALRWKDIDFKNGLLKVNQTLCRVKNFDGNVKGKTILSFDTPKTEKSKREIPLLNEVVISLRAHKARQSTEKLKAGELYNDTGLVFCNEIGSPIDPRKFTDIFYKLVEKSGIEKANVHAIRHTFATRGLENGIELKVMQELLGHSSIALTADTYSHVLKDKKREAINKLQCLISAQ